MGDPDFRWVGNECGIAPMPCWNTVDSVHFSVNTDEKDTLGGSGSRWLPAECDCRMREFNWFYSDSDEHTIKSLDRLMGLYYYSVGRGANLLINIGPDRNGLLPQKDAERLLEFGTEIKKRFSNPVLSLDLFKKNGMKLYYKATQKGDSIMIDHAVIGENLANGEHVRRFRIGVFPFSGSRYPITVYEGYNIGHKAICRFPAICAEEVVLEIIESDGEFEITELNFYYTSK
jgi:alpha-L-fucosidase